MMRTHGWVTYHDPHRRRRRPPRAHSQSSATAQKGRLNEWTENWWLVWIVRHRAAKGWYGDFYNLFTERFSLALARLMFFRNILRSISPATSPCRITSLFSIKSSGIYWMMMIHYIYFSFPFGFTGNWKKQHRRRREQKRRRKKNVEREVNKNVCDRMWLSRKKDDSSNFVGKLCLIV